MLCRARSPPKRVDTAAAAFTDRLDSAPGISVGVRKYVSLSQSAPLLTGSRANNNEKGFQDDNTLSLDEVRIIE